MPIKSTTGLETKFGLFTVGYHDINGVGIISLACNDDMSKTPLVRIHSGCLFAHAFASVHCDCREQFEAAQKAIKDHGRGVIVYSP